MYARRIEAGRKPKPWLEKVSVDPYRRNLQRAHIERLTWILTEEPEEYPDSPFAMDTPVMVSQLGIRDLPRDQLRTLREETRRVAERTGDRMTRVHLRDVTERIDRILEGDGDRSGEGRLRGSSRSR